MKKIAIFIVSLVLIGYLVFLGDLYFFYDKDKDFLKIDECFDAGGCWDKIDRVCRKTEQNAQELCHRSENTQIPIKK